MSHNEDQIPRLREAQKVHQCKRKRQDLSAWITSAVDDTPTEGNLTCADAAHCNE